MENQQQFRQDGNDAYKQGQFQKALECYSQGLKYGLEPQLLSNRSATLTQLSRYAEALDDAIEIIKLKKDWFKGYLRKGDAFFGLKQYQEALIAYQIAHDMTKDEVVAFKIEKTRSRISDNEFGFDIHQLSLGRQLGKKSIFSPINNMIFDYGQQMKNWIYVIAAGNEAVVIDPCWDTDGILDYISKLSLKLKGVIITHYHIDHCGGIPPPPFNKYPVRVDGAAKFKGIAPIYAHELEIDAIMKANPEMKRSDFVSTKNGDTIVLKNESSSKAVILSLLHTPGHTPGSQSVLVNNRLFSGDVLFIKSCGRCDFPDSSVVDMKKTLQRLSLLPRNVIVYPGHDYGGECTTIGREIDFGILKNPRI